MNTAPQLMNPVMMVVAVLTALFLITGMYWLRKRRLRKPDTCHIGRAMVGGPEVFRLNSKTRWDAIRELAGHAARILRWPDEETILQGLMKREAQMSTGLEYGIAVPHARFVSLGRLLVLFARSEEGIEWDCVDGQLARYIFLLLTPEEDEESQLRMLVEIGRAASDPESRRILDNATDCRTIIRRIVDVIESRE
jgi:mannitol/fructose-specific phosphotransferase system IIA component (Ntr-type)